MRFDLSAEQRDLQDVVRDAVAETAPPATVRAFVDGRPDAFDQLWRTLSTDIGLSGLLVPESSGGLGAGAVEMVLVQEELGRGLAHTPFLGTAVHAVAVLAAGTGSPADEFLAEIAAGAAVVGSSLTPAGALAAADGAWSGSVDLVVDAERAGHLLVPVTGGHVLLAAGDPGVTMHETVSLDPTRPLAAGECVGVSGVVITGGPATPLLSELAVAAEATGVAAQCLASTTEYAGTRMAFGRPIGGFQAVKHRLAEMYVEVESSRALVHHAAWALDSGAAEADELVAAAVVQATDTCYTAARVAIQVHGGIGFTHEHHAHLHLRRAIGLRQYFGAAASGAQRLGRSIGLVDLPLTMNEDTA